MALITAKLLAEAYDETEEVVKFKVSCVPQGLWDAAILIRPAFPCP
jgi:hypothetical protein